MKKTILTLALILITSCFLKAGVLPTDTTFQFNRKYVKIEEGNDQVKVKIFEKDALNDTVSYKQLYEGIFSDEKSYEKWTVQEVIGFDIPFLRKRKEEKKSMSIFMDGIGLGFANIADKSLNMTEVNGVSINAGSSHEWFFNFSCGTIPIYRNNLGIATGVGMSWLNLRLDKNTHLKNINGVTGVYHAPEEINYSLSRLMITRITIPLLLEWQPVHGKNKVFLSAGIVGGVKTYSSYKIKYREPDNRRAITGKERGLNTTPLSLDYMVRAGYRSIGIYAKYSPFSIFQSNKGPDVRAVSLGVMFYFDD